MNGSEARPTPKWPKLALGWILVISSGAWFLWNMVRLWGFLADDTYITLAYSRNIARGYGPVYNIGEHVEGYTNPLWTFLLALPYCLHVSPFAFLKIASGLLTFASAGLVYGLIRRYCHNSAPLALLGAALYLLIPSLSISSSEGLETPLFTALLLLGLWLWFEYPDHPSLAALAFAALALTRPDGIIFGLAAIPFSFFLKRNWRYTLRFAAVLLLVTGIHEAWRWWYYGWPLPNTFYAKGAGTPKLHLRGIAHWEAFKNSFGYIPWLVLFLACFLPHRHRREALVLIAFVVLRVQFHVWSGGPLMGHFRFLMPAVPLGLVLAVTGLDAALIHIWKFDPRWRTPAVGAVLTGVVLFCTAGDWRAFPGESDADLRYARNLEVAHIALGKDLARLFPKSATMVMSDAGAGKYYADLTNIDSLGLCDEHIGHLPGSFRYKFDVPYILSRRPDVIVMISRAPATTLDTRWVLPVDLVLSQNKEFQAKYSYWRYYGFQEDYYLSVFRRD